MPYNREYRKYGDSGNASRFYHQASNLEALFLYLKALILPLEGSICENHNSSMDH